MQNTDTEEVNGAEEDICEIAGSMFANVRWALSVPLVHFATAHMWSEYSGLRYCMILL